MLYPRINKYVFAKINGPSYPSKPSTTNVGVNYSILGDIRAMIPQKYATSEPYRCSYYIVMQLTEYAVMQSTEYIVMHLTE